MSQPPGHYPAEGDPPNTVRYWDGEQWVGDPIPAPPSAAAVPAVSGLAGGEPVSKMDRFLCVLLETVLAVVTLGIGWMIWALILVLRNEGQTPAKKIMNQKVMIEETGMPAGAARMIFLRGIVGGIILNIAFSLFVIPGLILLLLVFFDDKNRTFWERASGTVVIRA